MQTPHRNNSALQARSKATADQAAGLRSLAGYRHACATGDQEGQDGGGEPLLRHRRKLMWEEWAIGAIYAASIVNALVLLLF
jgi:hypothetical protein